MNGEAEAGFVGNWCDPQTGDFGDSRNTNLDNPGVAVVDPEAVFADQGEVTVLASGYGSRYTDAGSGFDEAYGAMDGETEPLAEWFPPGGRQLRVDGQRLSDGPVASLSGCAAG